MSGRFARTMRLSEKKRIEKEYEKLLGEYLETDLISSFQDKQNTKSIELNFDLSSETEAIKEFLKTNCGCGNNCQKQFGEREVLESRNRFRILSSQEKNIFILAQLRLLLCQSEYATSSRAKTVRQRKKFGYRVDGDRSVCRNTFLFYHGETISRLKRLQDCLGADSMLFPKHGNKGRKPANTYSSADTDAVIRFIANIAEIHGLPDPGRDVRKGKGRLRILLPSVMNFTSIHKLYVDSIASAGRTSIGYRTFLEFWKQELPHIGFIKPRSDLCMTCEDFKKRINQAVARLDEDKESLLIQLHEEALEHLTHAKKERLYYKAHSQVAMTDYENKLERAAFSFPVKPNSNKIVMSYSWDFSQQLQYPFESQQVGPIYFKTPRRAQLFGISCEGNFRQVNYLIDEANFLEKNANTVISFLDHYFANHGLGEKSTYLTADNCVGQNKNNAVIQYLMYRVLSKLHSKIEMSFLVVGHTKFSPDSHFGLIRQRYRHSQVYTYEQLAMIIEDSATDECNKCQRYDDKSNGSKIIYRDWTAWLSAFFRKIPGIKQYHHFIISSEEPGIVLLKNNVDDTGTKINLLDDIDTFNHQILERILPDELYPNGLSAEREWYLYNQIREHIPNELDKDRTCPEPTRPNSKKLN